MRENKTVWEKKWTDRINENSYGAKAKCTKMYLRGNIYVYNRSHDQQDSVVYKLDYMKCNTKEGMYF